MYKKALTSSKTLSVFFYAKYFHRIIPAKNTTLYSKKSVNKLNNVTQTLFTFYASNSFLGDAMYVLQTMRSTQTECATGNRVARTYPVCTHLCQRGHTRVGILLDEFHLRIFSWGENSDMQIFD